MLKDLMYILNYFAIGWIILMFLWLFFSLIFRLSFKSNHIKITMFISVCALSVIAFNYQPSEFADLYRIYGTLDIMRDYGSSFYNSNEIITDLLFRIVSKTEYNQFLPFVVTIIRYSLFFALLYKYIKAYKIQGYLIKQYVFFSFAFLSLIESISGIRYYFAITVLVYALIGEFYFNKKLLNKILYFVPLFIHTASSMFLVLRFLVVDKFYKLIKPYRFIIIFWTLFSDKIADILQNIGTNFTITTSKMLTFYAQEDRVISFRLTIARFILIVLIYTMFLMIKKKDKIKYKINSQYYNFIELTVLFTFGSVFHAVFFQRNVFFIVLMCMPLFFSFFKSEFIENKIKKLYFVLILILSIGMYMNQIYGLFVGYF